MDTKDFKIRQHYTDNLVVNYYSKEDLIKIINRVNKEWEERHVEDWFDVLKHFINSIEITNPTERD